MFHNSFQQLSTVITTILKNKSWPHQTHKMLMGLIIAVLQHALASVFSMFLYVFIHNTINIVFHYSFAHFSKVSFPHNQSTRNWAMSVASITYGLNFCLVLKPWLSHMQNSIVFKSIAFQSLHLNSTNYQLCKLEPCFSHQQVVDKSTNLQGCCELNAATYVEHLAQCLGYSEC